MQRITTMLLITVLVITVFSQTDSSDLLFEDLKVYTYELDFYSDNWESELEDNYEAQEYIPAKLTFGNITLDSIGVRYKGNSSYMMSSNTPKKPFKFKFDEYKDNQTLYAVKKLNFSNCAKDPSFMRETIGYAVARKYDIAPRTAFAKIVIEGELIGLYVQVEQVDKTFLEKHFESNDYNLYKVGDNGAGLEYYDENQESYTNYYELKTNETLNDWSAFVDMVSTLTNSSDDDFVNNISNHLNLKNAIKHLAFCQVFSHYDSYVGSGRNYYLYDDSTSGQFNIIPWDLNETFGNYSNNWNVITSDIVNISNMSQRPLTLRIIENDSLKQIYLGYIKDMIEGACSYDSISNRIDELQLFLDTLVFEDPNKLYTYNNFITNIDSDVSSGPMGAIPGLKTFITERIISLEEQLDVYWDGTVVANTQNSNIQSNIAISLATNTIGSFTSLKYSVPTNCNNVIINIYNLNGKRVLSFSEGQKLKGSYSLNINTENLSSGFYAFKIDTGNRIAVTKGFIKK